MTTTTIIPGVAVCVRCGEPQVVPVRRTPAPVLVPGRTVRVYPPLSESDEYDHFCLNCRGWTQPAEACPLDDCRKPEPAPPRCHAARDGDCDWTECPQNRDGEPQRSGRTCPLPWGWGEERE